MTAKGCWDFEATYFKTATDNTGTVTDDYNGGNTAHERVRAGISTTFNMNLNASMKAIEMTIKMANMNAGETLSIEYQTSTGTWTSALQEDCYQGACEPVPCMPTPGVASLKCFALSNVARALFTTAEPSNTKSFDIDYAGKTACTGLGQQEIAFDKNGVCTKRGGSSTNYAAAPTASPTAAPTPGRLISTLPDLTTQSFNDAKQDAFHLQSALEAQYKKVKQMFPWITEACCTRTALPSYDDRETLCPQTLRMRFCCWYTRAPSARPSDSIDHRARPPRTGHRPIRSGGELPRHRSGDRQPRHWRSHGHQGEEDHLHGGG